MQLKFKKITSWSNFETVGKDKGIYWLSFGGKSGYIGIVWGRKKGTTIFNRWDGRNGHDKVGEKWVSRTVKKKYPGWSLKIDKKYQTAAIHIWTYKTPRKRGRPPISRTTSSRKKILEAVESIIIFYVAKSRWNKSAPKFSTYKNKKMISSSNMLLNNQKLEGVAVAGKGQEKPAQEINLNYLKKHFGNRNLIIKGGPKDTKKIPNQKISYLVKEVFSTKPKLSTKGKAATKPRSVKKKPPVAKKKAAATRKKKAKPSKKKAKLGIGTKSNPYPTKAAAKKGRKTGDVWYLKYGKTLMPMKKK